MIQSDASKTGCGTLCQKTMIGGVWSQAEKALHINILELRAAKFAIITFCRYKKDLAVHVQMDNQAALAYLLKNRGARILLMIQEAKQIWEFCLANQITLTAEYLPGSLIATVEKTSSSKWILNNPIFKKLTQALGQVDLLPSRFCNQVPKYISWQPDPHAWIWWTHFK